MYHLGQVGITVLMLDSLKGKSGWKLNHVEVGQMFATTEAQAVAAYGSCF